MFWLVGVSSFPPTVTLLAPPVSKAPWVGLEPSSATVKEPEATMVIVWPSLLVTVAEMVELVLAPVALRQPEPLQPNAWVSLALPETMSPFKVRVLEVPLVITIGFVNEKVEVAVLPDTLVGWIIGDKAVEPSY